MQNWYFIIINLAVSGAQVLIIFVGGAPFSISGSDPTQTGPQWACAIVLGVISIPIGMVLRLIPDELISKCVPDVLKKKRGIPGLTISDEERFEEYPEVLADVRDELAFLKKLKGGRLNNLKFAVRQTRDNFISKTRSPSHSRSNSVKAPQTPTREDSFSSPSPAPTPDSRKRSRSIRSRSNSALGAPTVMAGIIAGSVAAGWSPIERTGDRDFPPTRPTPSPLYNREHSDLEPAPVLTEEPMSIEDSSPSSVPRLSVPQPPQKQKSIS